MTTDKEVKGPARSKLTMDKEAKGRVWSRTAPDKESQGRARLSSAPNNVEMVVGSGKSQEDSESEAGKELAWLRAKVCKRQGKSMWTSSSDESERTARPDMAPNKSDINKGRARQGFAPDLGEKTGNWAKMEWWTEQRKRVESSATEEDT